MLVPAVTPEDPVVDPKSKVMALDELAATLCSLRAAGKRIVQCHGVFDVLHAGHVRHFAAAKEMGDVLVVTLTPDRYVNKGPDRPAFTESLRAEVIGALDMVDYVAVNRWPTATETIHLLRPHIYAKGQDYEDAERDVTGGIEHEARAVAAVGGEVRFTQDITFSSSNLINRFFSGYPPEVNQYLDAFRRRHSADEIRRHVARLADLKVLVIGETILDQYIYCEALNRSGKEPILAMRYLSNEMYAGGSLAIGNHLAAFTDDVSLLTCLGSMNPHEDFVRGHLAETVQTHLLTKSGSPTIVKTRYVESYLLSKLFEIYEINDEPLSGRDEARFCDELEALLPDADVVIVADFGHGLVTPRAVQLLNRKARFLAVNTQNNAANMGYHTISKYPRADYVCIQEGEIRLDSRDRKEDLSALMKNVSQRLSCRNLMVTRGREGTVLYQQGEGFYECPSFAVRVVDRVGAGDAVFALTSLCSATGVPGDVIGFIGNLIGAQAVGIVGNSSSVDRVQLIKTVDAILK